MLNGWNDRNSLCLQSLYDRIDILLMPSRSEGIWTDSAIEGMARGCVVVGFRYQEDCRKVVKKMEKQDFCIR